MEPVRARPAIASTCPSTTVTTPAPAPWKSFRRRTSPPRRDRSTWARNYVRPTSNSHASVPARRRRRTDSGSKKHPQHSAPTGPWTGPGSYRESASGCDLGSHMSIRGARRRRLLTCTPIHCLPQSGGASLCYAPSVSFVHRRGAATTSFQHPVPRVLYCSARSPTDHPGHRLVLSVV